MWQIIKAPCSVPVGARIGSVKRNDDGPFYVVKTGAIRTGRPVPNLTADWTDHRGGTREEKKSPEKGCRVAQERR